MPREFIGDKARLRQILLEDWDPHNTGRVEAARGQYDTYVDPLYDLILSGAGEEQVMEWLHEREKETMCFPSLGRERLRRVAAKLVAVRSG